VGYKFTLVLNREITDDESVALRAAGCADAIFGADTLPTNADVPVTKMDFDTTSSPTLAEAIQSGLDAVKQVPDLSVPGLTVPAQPAGPVDQDNPTVVVGEKPEIISEERPAPKTTLAKKTAAKKPAAKKPAARKATAKPAAVPASAGSA